MMASVAAAAVSVDDLGWMLIAMVRYSLGRQTYAPGDAAALVRLYGKHIRPNDLATIRRSVAEHLARETREAPDLRETWQRLHDHLVGTDRG
jgi:hypothetical protein